MERERTENGAGNTSGTERDSDVGEKVGEDGRGTSDDRRSSD